MPGCADVCLDMDYENDNEFYSESLRTARKARKCCECQRMIQPRERYQYVSGKSDGYFWDQATCAQCAEVRRAFVCGSWVFGQLWESIEQVMFPVWQTKGPIDCLAKLTTPEAVSLCREQYRHWLEEQG